VGLLSAYRRGALPPPGVTPRVNRRHPLAQGLVAIYLPGLLPFDLCGVGPALFSRQNWAPGPTPFGQGGTGGAAPNNAASWAALPAALRLPGPLSLYFLGVQLAQVTGISDYFGFTASGTPSGTQTTAIRLYDTGSGGAVVLKWQDTGATLHTISGGSTPAVGARISVLGTVVIGGNGTLYRNGAQIAQAAGSSLNLEYSTPYLFVGAAQSTEYGANRSVMCAIWSRALSTAEAAVLDAAALADPTGVGGLLEWPWERAPNHSIAALNLTSDRWVPVETSAAATRDVDAAIESGGGPGVDRLLSIEAGARVEADPPDSVESGAKFTTDRLAPTESGASVGTDRQIESESAESVAADRANPTEGAEGVQSDRTAAAEAQTLLAPRDAAAAESGELARSDAAPPAESLATHASDRGAVVEILLTARPDPGAPIETMALLRADSWPPNEIAGATLFVSDGVFGMEAGTRAVADATGPAESAGSAARNQASAAEALLLALRDGAWTEWTLWQRIDLPASEESGSLLAGVRLLAGESGTQFGIDGRPLAFAAGVTVARDAVLPIEHSSLGASIYLPIEYAASVAADAAVPFDPSTSSAGAGGPTAAWLQSLGIASSQLFHAEAVVSPIRPLFFVARDRLRAASDNLVRPPAFAALPPGTSDNFAFDFTAEAGAASIVEAAWTCVLRPYQTVTDPAPQMHVVMQCIATQIATEMPQVFPISPAPAAVTVEGAFAIALVGGFTAAEVGAIYALTATVTLSDGRTLALSADLPIGLT
jgi:hypothetical protein